MPGFMSYAFCRICTRILAAVILFIAASVQAGETTNKIGITLVDIPAGSFQMGSSTGEEGDMAQKEERKRLASISPNPSSAICIYDDGFVEGSEMPRHHVNVKAFQIGKREVTVKQFKRFIKATGKKALMTPEFIKHNSHGDDLPVVYVSWDDAQAFIAWLNKIDGGGYRLPSEAEWEYACRAGSYHLFCGSNMPDGITWGGRDSTRVAPPPEPLGGEKRSNAFGLYDMSGHAKEWVQDCIHWDYTGAPTDGSAWVDGECNARVQRGGSWRNCIKSLRSASRAFNTPEIRGPEYGFRIARSR